MSWIFRNFGTKALAVAVALLLWGVSNSTSSIEKGFDLPLELTGVPENLVVTGHSSDAVNVRVKGSRSALRAFTTDDVVYPVDLSGAKVGVTSQEVDLYEVGQDLPRGAQIVSRSPASIDFTLERRATKAVKIRADLVGEPAEGFTVGAIELEPARVRITGARSEVLRLSEVLTETIDVSGADENLERELRPSPMGRHVWLETDEPIRVRVAIEPVDSGVEESG